MKPDDLTIKEAREIATMFGNVTENKKSHPMVGRRCLIRTYSAGEASEEKDV